MPKISVIIPTYNVASYIERCARSLFEQTLDDIECIFVNDCSPDDSLQVLQRVVEDYPHLKHNVKIVSNSVNLGVAATRNVGLSHATGKYIMWVDADDWIDSKIAGNLYNAIEQNNSDIAWCDFAYVYSDNDIVESNQECDDSSVSDCVKRMLSSKLAWMLYNKIYKRELFVDNDISFIDGINIGEDMVVSLKLFACASKVVYSPGAMYYYNRMNVSNITHSFLSYQQVAKQVLNINSVVDFYKGRGLFDKYEAELMSFVLLNKRPLLLLDKKYRQEWLNIYPE